MYTVGGKKKFKNKFNSHKIFIRKRHAINLKINRMCLKNICYCIDSSHNATYEANYQVNMQGNPVFMMLSNSSLYIQSTHVLKKKRQKVKQDIKRHIGLLSYLNTFESTHYSE